MKKIIPSLLSFLFLACLPLLLSFEKENLIQVSVVVTDKKGNFVEGLTKSDFEVYENTTKQNIREVYLREIKEGRMIIRRENGSVEEEPRNLFIIFDHSSTDPFHLQRIKEPLSDFLKKKFNVEDNIYFFMERIIVARLGRKLVHFAQEAINIRDGDLRSKIISEMITNLTEEVVDITFSPEIYPDIPETPDKGWNPRQKPKEFLSDFEMDYRKFITFNFLDRLKAITSVAEKIQGEKIALLVSENPEQVDFSPLKSEPKGPTAYISGGFFRGFVVDDGKTPLPGFNYPSYLRELFSHSETTVYSLHLEPVRRKTPQLESTDIFKNILWDVQKTDPLSAQSLQELQTGSPKGYYQDFIRNLSKDSGGIAFTRAKNLEKCLNQIGQAMEKSYIIAFSPSDKEREGKFRNITVKVNRKGLKVRHRKGYYAIDMEKEELKQLIKSLEEKVRSERLITFIRHKTIPLENNENYLLVKMEPRGLTVNDVTESEKGVVKSSLVSQMRLYFRLEDERGKIKAELEKKFDFKIDERELHIRPAIYFGEELEKGKYRMEVALKDRIGEEITSAEEVIEVEDMERLEGGIDNAIFVKKDGLTRELNEIRGLFVYEGEKLYPRIDHEFHPQENLHLYFVLNSKDENGVDLYFQITREDDQLFKTYRMSSPLERETNPFLVTIPLIDFPQGDYVFQITALERGSRKHHISRKNFQVIF